MNLDRLFERELVVVMGKGGVGRSSLAAALALSAGQRGKRVLIVEMSGCRDVAQYVGLAHRSYEPRPWRDGVDLASLTPAECLEDFGRRKLRTGALLKKVLNNRVSRAFLEAVPGLHDLLQLGKVENLLSEPLPGDTQYDLVVLDAPATGHGLTLLSAARTLADLTRIGPFHDLATVISGFLSDRQRTALVLVTLPEDLPVQESLELRQALQADGADLTAVVVNRLSPSPVPDANDWPLVREALTRAGEAWVTGANHLDKAVDAHRQQEALLARLAEVVAPTPLFAVFNGPLEPHSDRLEAMAADLEGAR